MKLVRMPSIITDRKCKPYLRTMLGCANWVNLRNVFEQLIRLSFDPFFDEYLIPVVRFLVEVCDVDPYLSGDDGSTILHRLPYGGDLLPLLTSTVFPLVKPPDSAFNKFNTYGMTPLQELLQHHDYWNGETLRFLLLAGTDVNLPSPALSESPHIEGLTALHYVLAAGRLALGKPTVYYFEDLWSIQIADSNNFKCKNQILTRQKRDLQRRMIQTLVQNGANVRAVPIYWGTPSDVAEHFGNLTLWVDIPDEMGFDIATMRRADLSIQQLPQVSHTYGHHNAAPENRQLVDRKVRELWDSIGSWDGYTKAKTYTSSLFIRIDLARESTSSRIFRACTNPRDSKPLYQIFLLQLLSGEHLDSKNMKVVYDAEDNCLHSTQITLFYRHHMDSCWKGNVCCYARVICTKSESRYLGNACFAAGGRLTNAFISQDRPYQTSF